ncbi:MAG: DevC protein [Rickettsiales bacterium]|jgi:putative ABC transport system permease protein|nr:DevC protein [Rickettsiales bacterium]
MRLDKSFYFAARLSWRQLTFERAKLIAAILGVLFACVLVFMQLGFRDSLYYSTGILPHKMDGDLFLVHRQTEAIWRTQIFSRSELMRVWGNPNVAEVYPLYVAQAPFKNPEKRTKRTLMVFGYAPEAKVFNHPDIVAYQDALTLPDTAIFDMMSRPEFGPLTTMLQKGRVFTELNDRRIEVIGTFKMGISFAADGNMIISDQNFQRIFPLRNVEQIDIGVIRLKIGSDVKKVQEELRGLLSEDVNLFTHKEFVAFEMGYWANSAPIGFIFGFGMIMGLVVGMVIVYQILFTDITNHLHEYATLKALGYSHRYLILVVFASSLILAVIGFIPGAALSFGLYKMAESVTYIPMPMPFTKVLYVFSLILGMCTISGSLAMRKMRSANPANMF